MTTEQRLQFPPPRYLSHAGTSLSGGTGTGNVMNRRALAATVMLVAAASFTIASGSSSSSGSGASGSSSESSETENSEAAPSEEASGEASESGSGAAPASGLNQAVRDGKFEFTVKKVKCGVKSVGGDFLETKAQGQFCLVTMKIKNIGTEAQTFDASSQEAKNGEVTYKADGTASLYANEDPNTFLNEINPGNSVTAIVVFDIPKNGKLQTLVLHDSPFSGGVEIKAS